MARKLYVNVDESRLVGGINSSLPPVLDNLVEADNVDYELYFLTASSGDTLYEPLNYSTASIKFAVGPTPPSAASAYALQTSWTNLPSTVTATLSRVITGTAAINEQQKLVFAPEAFDGTFSLTFPSQLLTFSSVSAGLFTTSGSHGLSISQAFVVTGFSSPTGFSNGSTLYVARIASPNSFFANTTATSSAITSYSASSGTGYTITSSTVALPARSSTSELQQALQSVPAIGVDNVQVSGTAGREYRLSFKNSKGQVALPLMTVAAALTPIFGKSANVNFNTTSLVSAISATAVLDAALEIEVTQGGSVETVLQTPVSIKNEVIASSTTSPSALPGGGGSAYSFVLLSPNNSQWEVTIDNQGIITSTKL